MRAADRSFRCNSFTETERDTDQGNAATVIETISTTTVARTENIVIATVIAEDMTMTNHAESAMTRTGLADLNDNDLSGRTGIGIVQVGIER